jgi:hypothetical protein
LDFAATVRRRGYAIAAAGLAVAFLVTCLWWSLTDSATQAFDPGRHLLLSFHDHDLIRDGHLGKALSETHVPDYPPLVHLLGAVVVFLFGYSVDGPVLAMDFVFIPLLAVGCYGLGRHVAGPRGGLISVGFVLGAPLVLEQSHSFLVDLPMTSMLAAGLWLLVRSDRFADPRSAALAGVALGLGFLCKQTLPFYAAGAVVVLLSQGGWRNWRGVVAAAAPFLILALPWSIVHWHAQTSQVDYVVGPRSEAGGGGGVWSVNNFAWFGWGLFNLQVLVPLCALAAAGAALAVRWRRDLALALLASGAVGWALAALYLAHNIRYTLPLVVPLAGLAAGVVLARRGVRRVAIGVLVVAGVLNAVNVNTAKVGSLRVSLPNPDTVGVREHSFTFFTDDPNVTLKPFDGSDLAAELRRLKAHGTRTVAVDPTAAANGAYSIDGVTVAAAIARVGVTLDAHILRGNDVYITRRTPTRDLPAPCLEAQDGTGLYLQRGLDGPFAC